MLKDTWTDKQDGVDMASAEDINSVANAVVDLEISSSEYAKTAKLNEHIDNKNNPHSVNAEQVGAYSKEYIDTQLGDISSALDSIIALQNGYIGGASA